MKFISFAISLFVTFLFCFSGTLAVGSSSQGNIVHSQLVPQTTLPGNLNPAPQLKGCQYSGYGCPPANGTAVPMGIADYGYNEKAGSAYTYTAHAFRASVTFTSLNISSVSAPVAGKGCMGIQLNAIAYNFTAGMHHDTYWTQDVIGITQGGLSGYSTNCQPGSASSGQFNVYAEDNIWNFTRDGSTMGPNSTSSNGNKYLIGGLNNNCSGGVFPSFGDTYYACAANQNYVVTLPFRIVSIMWVGVFSASSAPASCKTSVPSCIGDAFVQFYFAVYDGSGTNTLVGSSTYDEVAFNGMGVEPQSTLTPPKYLVQNSQAPSGISNDVEEVLCGPGSGSSVNLTSVAGSMFVQYEATESSNFVSVPHAYSWGSETAETVLGVLESYSGGSSGHQIVSLSSSGGGSSPYVRCQSSVGPSKNCVPANFDNYVFLY